jgi:hypothetical protein
MSVYRRRAQSVLGRVLPNRDCSGCTGRCAPRRRRPGSTRRRRPGSKLDELAFVGEPSLSARLDAERARCFLCDAARSRRCSCRGFETTAKRAVPAFVKVRHVASDNRTRLGPMQHRPETRAAPKTTLAFQVTRLPMRLNTNHHKTAADPVDTIDVVTDALDYEIRGAGPGLVLIHGTGSTGMGSWGTVVGALIAEHTVLLLNLPGSGGSPLPDGALQIEVIADQVVATAQKAGLESFAVAGASLGAAVAIKVAARHPERVLALATVAGYARLRPTLRLNLELWAAMQARGDADLGKLLVSCRSRSDTWRRRRPRWSSRSLRSSRATPRRGLGHRSR